jgi:hypothetical protein
MEIGSLLREYRLQKELTQAHYSKLPFDSKRAFWGGSNRVCRIEYP